MDVDLVLLGLGGVHRFIAESRTTADVANASLIMQRLAAVAAHTVTRESGALIYPVVGGGDRGDEAGVTNTVAFTAQAGDGARVAEATTRAVVAKWHDIVTVSIGSAAETSGFPDVWWVCVTGPADDHSALWDRATKLAAARRRSRVFAAMTATSVWPCALSPHLPSVRVPGRNVRHHERRERLSALGWVKRTYERGGARPATRSTLSIASTPYRVELLSRSPNGLAELVGSLREAAGHVADLVSEAPVLPDVPDDLTSLATELGPWVYPEVWDEVSLRREHGVRVAKDVVGRGRDAALGIARLAEAVGVRRPSPYYAIVTQDVDHLGRAIGRLGPDAQRAASGQLVALGRAQRAAIVGQDYPGVPVYTGGDDLLAFCSAASALRLAAELRRLVDEQGPLGGGDGQSVTASTAVVFAHMSAPLRTAIARAREALHEAKATVSSGGDSRDALAVVVLRRGGERAHAIQPWAISPVDLLNTLRPSRAALSGGLASQLERDEAALSELAVEPVPHATLEAELTRLVCRRGGTPKEATALHTLAFEERTAPVSAGSARGAVRYRPVAPLLVARFLAQECGVALS